ncbi:MAG TPA: hypothetical protein VNX86_04055 [Rhizomicrobium sp.]|nr:hypothetical protein [Rhizomicrobium sp.]
MNQAEAKDVLQTALEALRQNDLTTFGEDVGERPIMFRVAHYMISKAETGESLHVDCDYNRSVDAVKQLLPMKEETFPEADKRVKVQRFFPDIVIHKRRDDSENILVCEIKKVGDSRGPELDRRRLQILTRQDGYFHYILGAFIEVDQAHRRIIVEYFENGEAVNKWSTA